MGASSNLDQWSTASNPAELVDKGRVEEVRDVVTLDEIAEPWLLTTDRIVVPTFQL